MAESRSLPCLEPGCAGQRIALHAGDAWRNWAPLPPLVALALGLNAWGLARAGYGNTNYAAATRAMTAAAQLLLSAPSTPAASSPW